MKKVKLLIGIGCCLIACMVCPAAFAQEETPVAELFGGLSLLKMKDHGGMYGWGAGFAVNLNPNLAVKVDTSGTYASITNSSGYSTGGTAKNHNVLGGIQYTRRYEDFSVFGEALGGLTNHGESSRGISDSVSGFGMSFGGGADYFFSPRFGWRTQLNYIAAFFNEDKTEGGGTKHSYRFQTGIVIRLGMK